MPSPKQPRGLSSFDRLIVIFILGLLVAIGSVIAWRPPVPEKLGPDQAYRQPFQEGAPSITYLAAPEGSTRSLYRLNPDQAEQAQKLTQNNSDIIEYDVTKDGRYIVYTERRTTTDQTLASDIYRWNQATAKTEFLYTCEDALCTNLTWRPDGEAVAFMRVDLNSKTQMPPGYPRVWIYNLVSKTAQPLFEDNQRLGVLPCWSPDSAKIAVYDQNAGAIVVHDFGTDQDHFIPTFDIRLMNFSPDGRWLLYYPGVAEQVDTGVVTNLKLVDLSTEPYREQDLKLADESVGDIKVIWQNDSAGLFLAWQPQVQQITPGAQLYRLDLSTGTQALLLPGETYHHSNLDLSPTGERLVFERTPAGSATAIPDIWTYHLATGDLKQVVEGAILPRWVP